MESQLFVYTLLTLSVYIFPTIIAAARKHRSTNSIFIINLFLGWTLVGWVVSLAWAVSGNVENTKAD